jgi:hypothetical protein
VAAFLGSASWPVSAADELIELPFANGRCELASNFPQKGPMILQRTRPPLLETPFEVFDQGVFTPNDRFYVRWHGRPAFVTDAKSMRQPRPAGVKRPLR